MKGSSLKSKKILFEGRSVLLNAILVLTNLVAAGIILRSFLDTAESSNLQSFIGVALFIVSFSLLVVLKGFYMYSYFGRYALALVLLISGFVKLNDPVGFSETLHHIFNDGAFASFIGELMGWEGYSLAHFNSWNFKIVVVLALAEILLALMLLYHIFYKVAIWLTLGLMSVFVLNSWYNYDCKVKSELTYELSINSSNQVLDIHKNPVFCMNDSGFLGDSHNEFLGIEMSANVAFSAGIILLLLTLILVFTQFSMLPNSPFESTAFGVLVWITILVQGIMSSWFWLVLLSGLVLYLATNLRRFGMNFFKSSLGTLMFIALLLSGLLYYVISFEPLTDFRPYAIGNSLLHEVTENDLKKEVYVFQNKENGKFLFLDGQNNQDTLTQKDTNYIFLRTIEHNVNPFYKRGATYFQPIFQRSAILNNQSKHPLIEEVRASHYENLHKIYNKQNGVEQLMRADEFSTLLFKDTNLVIEKFNGIHTDVEFVDMSKAILDDDLIFIWVIKFAHLISNEQFAAIQELTAQITAVDLNVVAMGFENTEDWEKRFKKTKLNLIYLKLNRQEIYKICRSNVCLLVLKKGVVVAKYPLRGLPKFETISSKLRLE